MSNATWTAIVCAALASGCATGTNTNGGTNVDAAVQPHHDAPHVNADAPVVKTDAGVAIDAPRMPDAAVDAASSLFCTDNSQCTNAGECCFSLGGQGLCTTGQVVLGACIPQ